MNLASLDIQSLWCALLVEECIRQGVDYFCISPGSRSTPLTIAVARHPSAKSILCLDERGGAFHALGYARATQKTAVLICTSGTAVANYLPAVIEAEKDFVPLLILSADRPAELRETGANQTISQTHLFQDYVRWKYELPCPEEKVSCRMILTTIAQAIYQTKRAPAGPVHLNCPFREPLEPFETAPFSDYLKSIRDWIQSKQPFTTYFDSLLVANSDVIEKMAEQLNQTQQGLVLLGRLPLSTDRKKLWAFLEKLGWPVLADITSGGRLGGPSFCIPFYDQILLADTPLKKASDCILHFGGPLTSKRLLQYCAQFPPQHYIQIKSSPFRADPNYQVTQHLEASIDLLLESLLPKIQPQKKTTWNEFWQRQNQKVSTILSSFIQESQDLHELGLAYLLSQKISEQDGLFLGSSMPIRDMDMYSSDTAPAIPIGANRGASGIDGTLASATGFAVGLKKTVTVLLGDLSLLHDLNALVFLSRIPQKVIVIVINNQGGGIFSFLPISKVSDVFETYFATPHSFQFQEVARNFQIPYFQVKTQAEFIQTYQNAQQFDQSVLIEVQTDRQANWEQHQALQLRIKQSLNESML